MNMIQKIVHILFATAILSSCSNNYWTYDEPNPSSSEHAMPSEPGKCYAKCLKSDMTEIEYEYYYRYTGQEKKVEGVQQATTGVRYRNLTVVEEKGSQVMEVVDTALVKDFVVDSFAVIQAVETGGSTEWKEIVCDSDVTEYLYRKVQQGLVDQGYQLDVSGKVNQLTKTALLQFQKEKSLPIGALNFETLEALGVDPP